MIIYSQKVKNHNFYVKLNKQLYFSSESGFGNTE